MNAMPLGEIFWNCLSASFSMKEGTNSTNLDSIVIPKAIGVCKSLFHVCTPKETKSMSISLPCVEQVDHHSFVLTLSILPGDGCRKGLEDKTYPAMDSPVHGKFDDVSCILVEDCNHKL